MKTLPIIFGAEAVRAILDGTKTQTRVAMDPQPCVPYPYYDGFIMHHPRAWEVDGDLWTPRSEVHPEPTCDPYRGEPVKCPFGVAGDRLAVAPGECLRFATPIVLEVADVRVERLQAITEDDAQREGVDFMPSAPAALTHRGSFAGLWDKDHDEDGLRWKFSPWVWIAEFKRVKS